MLRRQLGPHLCYSGFARGVDETALLSASYHSIRILMHSHDQIKPELNRNDNSDGANYALIFVKKKKKLLVISINYEYIFIHVYLIP